jgi:hypothetical protein
MSHNEDKSLKMFQMAKGPLIHETCLSAEGQTLRLQNEGYKRYRPITNILSRLKSSLG